MNLFKKYDYLSSELELKNEISNVSRLNFLENVQKLIDSNEQLKQAYQEPLLSEKQKLEENKNDTVDEVVVERQNTDETLKKLYRKIVKLTHPDQINNDYLNSIYIEATDSIDKNNRLSIFKICIILGIEFELPEDLATSIFEEIESIQKRIAFIDTSYHMRWHNSKKEERIDIILDYMKKQFRLSEA